ncbi:MAG: tRNA preQ1(34) S-adenosylmethionine ribosyltransferase-isomerase QueA [bacterium]
MRDSSFAIDRDAAGELVASYDYELPADAVAQRPPRDRESARLLVLDRASARREERVFREIRAFLRAGDALVVNDTRVVPARLAARIVEPSRALEILLLREVAVRRWRVLVKPAKHARVGARIAFEPDGPRALVAESGEAGERVLEFEEGSDLAAHVAAHGAPPLPPYIRRAAEPSDRDDYQTVYAREPGAIAAPTAGLHFTERLLDELRAQGVRIVPITLDVGLPTFRPLREDALAAVRLGAESYTISGEASEALRDTRARGGRVVAVGTTVVRALESAWDDALGAPRAGRAETTLFVRPGHRFRAIDALVTNFHWPRTSLLVLVAAFAGREAVLAAYADALARGFRFASYGDAMLIT